ncbi:mechanosensitive ion channel protein MscS [Corynebacterium sp. 13CS0277]|uniref:mechanosensitive ion channel family protein n=1 Tax=Corynebacterium sp. 13CS0277 TaxID=2071994 RepID=UPI000D032743|nr:mechanosensitive ion channel family protein [Corynebacterium sp. 13CS0277]PRQ11772.1 mechanosensitive ion channel protein MscS [Corynebacterium sp. 13CS0277]
MSPKWGSGNTPGATPTPSFGGGRPWGLPRARPPTGRSYRLWAQAVAWDAVMVTEHAVLPLIARATSPVHWVRAHWDAFSDKPAKVLVVLVVALLLHVLLRRLVTTVCTRAQRGDSPRQGAHMQTLASVGRSAVAIVVWTWAGITLLSTVGINVAPLIASAGVAGVALGFGAQSLVKDFLTGVFMLIEDQYGVGDEVTVGDVSGTVENVTLRVTTIRDAEGTRWYIRNGQITQVGNSTQETAVARVEVPVEYSNRVDEAVAAIGAASREVAADPEYASLVRGEPVVDGVTSLETDHMVIRVHVPTAPGAQGAVRRALLAAIVGALTAPAPASSDGDGTPAGEKPGNEVHSPQ